MTKITNPDQEYYVAIDVGDDVGIPRPMVFICPVSEIGEYSRKGYEEKKNALPVIKVKFVEII